MKEEVIGVIIGCTGERGEAFASSSTTSPWRVILSCSLLNYRREVIGDDLFSCLSLIREDFEREGAVLLCKGSKPNVWPSGMSREMSGGRMGYTMEFGKPTRRDQMVDIFDHASPDEVGSVQEQRDFIREWRRRWLDEGRISAR